MKRVGTVSALLLTMTVASAQDNPGVMVKSESGVELTAGVDWNLCARDGVAVGGYDLVSYRREGGPVKGDPEVFLEHEGRIYWFANRANREIFAGDPERYLPAYSGFCAITLALGRVTCPDYTNYQIENDRLLLFEVTGFTNGRTLWNTDAAGYREQANSNFDRLVELR